MEVGSAFQVDPAYEFDAPKYYNFGRLSTGDSNASDWFNGRDCDGVGTFRLVDVATASVSAQC